MTKLQPINQLIEQLNVPVQDLAQLSFCDGSREASIKAWVKSLPLTQIQFVSGLLYQALPDIGRYKTAPAHRIALLETLRAPTLQAIEGLAQGFLNQPLILPEPAVKTATIAQALQKHMINGYLVAVRDLCKEANPNKPLLALGIHRAITGLGLLLLRYYQLYVPISGQIWTELHSLYQIALQLQLSEQPIAEPHRHHEHCNTIQLAYVRTLLLACSRPNQLRQDEILATYEALNNLSALAQLDDAISASHDNLFAVALTSNRPPLYRSRFKDDDKLLLLELNTAQVCRKLMELNNSANTESSETTGLRNELHLTSSLTLHLIQAWNILAQRNFERQQAHGSLDVAIGLTNIHYHLAGKVAFSHFLNRNFSSLSLETQGAVFPQRDAQLKEFGTKSANYDPWDDAFDVRGPATAGRPLAAGTIDFAVRKQEAISAVDAHPIYTVPLIDSSPGGYCIEWRTEIPNQVKAGELLGLRDPARNRWSLGVVRWVNQTKGASQLGIQVIAPQATPIGLAIIHKTGASSEYLRALEVPAMKAINQPATLITNAVSFREYSKARVFLRNDQERNVHESTIQLTRRVFATGAFSQFTYRELATGKPKETDKNDDFDAVWDS